MLNSLRVIKIFLKTLGYYLILMAYPFEVIKLKKRWAATLLKDFQFQIEEHGEAPKNKQSPIILVGNHISYLDILLIMAHYPEVVFLAKREVKSWPIIGLGAKRIGTIFVDRNNKESREKARFEIAKNLINTNSQLAVFPSGTTTLDESTTWKKGIFEIAKENSIKIKAFKISYTPLRESAYIEDDNLLMQMKGLFAIKNKTARLTWLDEYDVDIPEVLAEHLRINTSAQQ